jgi:hypothetical protein
MTKNVYGASDLTLSPNSGESILVTGVRVFDDSSEYSTIQIDKTTVGYFRVSETNGNHISFNKAASNIEGYTGVLAQNLLGLMLQREVFKGYPVGEGETFRIVNNSDANELKQVSYDIYDAGDIKPEDENGSKSSKYFAVLYGDTGAVIAAAGDALYDNALNPAEFPSFPYSGDVPANTLISLHGILGREVGIRNATPATAIYTTYLKLVKGREVLFDPDRNGLLFNAHNVLGTSEIVKGGGLSVIGDFSNYDPRPPLLFDEPVMFQGGEELNMYLSCLEPVDASSIATAQQTIGLICTIDKSV